MRAALAIVMTTLALGGTSRLMLAQVPADATTGFESIRMIDATTGWAVTDGRYVGVCGKEGCLLRTTDGGANWREATPLRSSGSEIRVWKFTVLSSLIAWVVPGDTQGTNAQIFRSVDGGRTWRSATIPAPSVTSISFINLREGWLIASIAAYSGHHEDEIYRSTNGGETWIKVAGATRDNNSSGLPDGAKTSVTFLTPTTGWITGIRGLPNVLYLYVTHDSGHTWRQQDVPLPRELTPHWEMTVPQPPPKFFTARDGILPAFYELLNDSGKPTGIVVVLYATHDSGTTWTYTTPVSVAWEVVHHGVADMNHAWVLDGGVLRATSDGGRRWGTMPPNPFFADVTQVDFISQQVGWMTRRTFPFLLKTLDGGHTWTPVPYTILRE